jgi:hypothetical protein
MFGVIAFPYGTLIASETTRRVRVPKRLITWIVPKDTIPNPGEVRERDIQRRCASV